MSAHPLASERPSALDLAAMLGRFLVGGAFIYMGLSKALHPVEFLKLVRQYGVLHDHLALNLVASALPWFEIFCGVLLVLGIAVRGTSLMVILMLVSFTILVLLRALEIYHTGKLPFCSIKFDCGCGAGEVLICRKLAENALLTAISAVLVLRPQRRLSLRYQLV